MAPSTTNPAISTRVSEEPIFPLSIRTLNIPDSQQYTLHTLHARDERSLSVDVITIITSIVGILIAIIGLVEGYRRWRKPRRDLSPAVDENHKNMHVQQPTRDTPPDFTAADANHLFYAACTVLVYIRMANHIPGPDNERDASIARVSAVEADAVELDLHSVA